MLADAHVHFFSQGFFRALGGEAAVQGDAAQVLPTQMEWDSPGPDEALADRWGTELDSHGVDRAMLIASTHGDEASVAAACARHPKRFVGAFMLNAGADDAPDRARNAFLKLGLSTVCLFPALHRVPVDSPQSEAIFAEAGRCGGTVFVHCGVLSIGARKKLGLPSRFDLRLGDPLAVAAVAASHPEVSVVIPHFGAGFFREALMAAGMAPNVHLDTSSSNSWMRLYPGLTLRAVFDRALDVVGARRLLFGTDSSYFPRGWQRSVLDQQQSVLEELGVQDSDRSAIFGGNFARLFPLAR